MVFLHCELIAVSHHFHPLSLVLSTEQVYSFWAPQIHGKIFEVSMLRRSSSAYESHFRAFNGMWLRAQALRSKDPDGNPGSSDRMTTDKLLNLSKARSWVAVRIK